MKNKKITIFLYHEINDNPSKFCLEHNLNVSKKIFYSQIKWINNNYDIISPKKLIENHPLPKKPALITFDDGFYGAFNDGIKFLIKNKIPSITFLNMGHILNESPLISSKVIFYKNYCKELKINPNKLIHLEINPEKMFELEKKLYKNYDDEIFLYQGRLASYSMIKKFANNKYVYFGNHLYQHWNSPALKSKDFISNIEKNEQLLFDLKNYCKLFAFTNGQFNDNNIDDLEKLGFKKVLQSSGKINNNIEDFILDRVSLTNLEYNSYKLYLRTLKSKTNNFFINKFLGLLTRI